MNKIDEFVKKHAKKLPPDPCYGIEPTNEDELRADLHALIESLMPSDEDIRMEFPIGGTVKAGYNRDYAEMIKDNQSRRLGAFWLRSRILSAMETTKTE